MRSSGYSALYQGHPSSFATSYSPHVVGWHCHKGSMRPTWAKAGRDPQPLQQVWEKNALLCPNFKCTNSSGCQTSTQGSHKRVFHLHFRMDEEGCKPRTHRLPIAICRHFSKLGSWVLSLPAGAGGRYGWAEEV